MQRRRSAGVHGVALPVPKHQLSLADLDLVAIVKLSCDAVRKPFTNAPRPGLSSIKCQPDWARRIAQWGWSMPGSESCSEQDGEAPITVRGPPRTTISTRVVSGRFDQKHTRGEGQGRPALPSRRCAIVQSAFAVRSTDARCCFPLDFTGYTYSSHGVRTSFRAQPDSPQRNGRRGLL